MFDVDRYLRHLDLTEAPTIDLPGLTALQQAHLRRVPFENLDVYRGVPVRTDVEWSFDKIVNRGRGGWCFELNGAFGHLLESLGFEVRRLGAAVLLSGPTTTIDHLTLEVSLDRPYLVDVGFGDSFICPLELNRAGPQDGGSSTFELIPSAQGTTLTKHESDGFPAPQFRFRRVTHQLSDFEGASVALQENTSLNWHERPIATRLLGDGPDRISLAGTTLKRVVGGTVTRTTHTEADIPDILLSEFGIDLTA